MGTRGPNSPFPVQIWYAADKTVQNKIDIDLHDDSDENASHYINNIIITTMTNREEAVRVIYDNQGNKPKFIGIDELFEEFRQLTLFSEQRYHWDLSNHGIYPELLRLLFTLIKESQIHLQTTLAIDLSFNRLGDATVDDFKLVIKTLIQERFHRMLIRFGFEIFLPNLRQALREMNQEGLYGERLLVNSPWYDDRLTRITEELKSLNEKQQKQLSATEKKIADMERRIKDPTEELKQIRSYRDTDAYLVEECVSMAIAKILEDANKIHSTRYVYEAHSGDLDGLVSGVYQGDRVLVLIEAKHNMDSTWRKAQSELFDSVEYIEELRKLDLDTADDAQIADYKALQIENSSGHRLMIAFGGSKFSQETAEKHFKHIRLPWFHVSFNSEGQFIATQLYQ